MNQRRAKNCRTERMRVSNIKPSQSLARSLQPTLCTLDMSVFSFPNSGTGNLQFNNRNKKAPNADVRFQTWCSTAHWFGTQGRRSHRSPKLHQPAQRHCQPKSSVWAVGSVNLLDEPLLFGQEMKASCFSACSYSRGGS